MIDTIAEYAPNIKDLILHRQVLTPLDLERDFGLTEGNIFQGELSLEQLFFLRPVPGWAQLPTPVRQPLHVRLGDASRRRHHGRAGTQRARSRVLKERQPVSGAVAIIGGGPQRAGLRGAARARRAQGRRCSSSAPRSAAAR